MSALRNRVNIIMACGSHTCLAVSSIQEADASQNERQLVMGLVGINLPKYVISVWCRQPNTKHYR